MPKKQSTNPFDDSFSDSRSSNADYEEILHECNDGVQKSQRLAQIDFNAKSSGEAPALKFGGRSTKDTSDPSAFSSLLEDALEQDKMAATLSRSSIQRYDSEMNSSIESEEDDRIVVSEESPLLSTTQASLYASSGYAEKDSTGTEEWEWKSTFPSTSSVQKTSTIKRNTSRSSLSIDTGVRSRRSGSALPKSRVLKELTTTRQEDEYKLIRLEGLGTAKSWMILLLPYFAFAVCVLLESDTSLKIAELGPLSGRLRCFRDRENKEYSVPIPGSPPDPCMYLFDLSVQDLSPLTIDDQTPRQQKNTTRHEKIINKAWGAAFESGIITSVPPATTFLSADASFYKLSLKSMAAIQKGSVFVSGMLFQKRHVSTGIISDWSVVANSRTEPLSMACYFELNVKGSERQWVCQSPKMVEFLFAMPGSAILSGEELRISILISYSQAKKSSDEDSTTYLYADQKLHKMLKDVQITTEEEAEDAVSNIVASSQFILQHTNPTSLTIDVWGRIVALIATVAFAIFWFRSLGFLGCCSCSCLGKDREDLYEIRQAITMLDSPWVLFPERWYIAVLFFAIVLIQGPLVVLMYFYPHLNTIPMMKAASDTLVGVGVNAVMFVYLSLFEGFQFHTASAARKWMDQHRKLNEIRRTASYVASGGKGKRDDGLDENETMIRYTADYFEKHGDIDGTLSLTNLRLCHDPFGVYWADFLLPKLFLFALGVISIWLTAYTRFHFTSDENVTISPEILKLATTVYLVCYFVQFCILILWVILITRSSIVTGHKLRLQPFLSTRPAQLAYRVLFAHVTLGFLSLVVLVFVGLDNLLKQWRGGDESPVPMSDDQDPMTSINFWLQLLTRLTQRFPYSGTATSIGFGRIFFATVSILIAAFIFLPPKDRDSLEKDETKESEATHPEDRIRQRRDKRAVISMLKYSHTWRIFPLPIERASVVETMLLSKSLFQLYSNGQRDYNNLHDSGVVSVGPYVPVFCIELACWLLEASFQAYYSPTHVEWNDDTPGKMNLNSIGLRLESAIFDEATNTQAFVATNLADQVDGEEDSIIVIAFRGSVDSVNAKTDLKFGMVPLPDQLIGIGRPPFRVSATGVAVDDSDGWVWNAPPPEENHTVSCFSTSDPSYESTCLPFPSLTARKKKAPLSAVSKGAMAVLSATPVARNTLPCVHEGFNEVYAVLRKKVIESLLPVLRRQLAKELQRKQGLGEGASCLNLPKIYITGHSLGGSLAQLLALDLASNCELIIEGDVSGVNLKPEAEIFRLPTPTCASADSAPRTESGKTPNVAGGERVSLQPPICCYTYGQPRVGNRAFSRLYKQRVPHTFRVATEGDPLTAMPAAVCCAGIYKHAGLEVVLDEGKTGNMLVGPTVVETLFRFHKVRTNLAAHSTNRYRDCLESALEPHELQEYYRGHTGAAGLEEGYGLTQTQNNQDVPDWMTQGLRSTAQ